MGRSKDLISSAVKEIWKIKDNIYRQRKDWDLEKWLEKDEKITQGLKKKGLLFERG
ncbi:MAG: hypothetical protein J7J51_02160 [Candidatus Omnitrophica bacterium]|nr:hypothetical protein [Candidatus Omnitrophota bacterium]